MARRKQSRASSGAPSVRNGMGPALNPIGLSNARGGKGLYLDGNVALAEFKSEWEKFFDDPKKVQRFSQPVRSRI